MESHEVWAYAGRMCGRTIAVISVTAAIVAGEDRAPHTIAFGSFAPVRPTVFIAGPNGEGAKPLLREPNIDYNASFSQDGAWIVFTSERGRSADIWRVHPDGSGLERLTDHPSFDDQAALSPDGRTLAFLHTRRAGQYLAPRSCDSLVDQSHQGLLRRFSARVVS